MDINNVWEEIKNKDNIILHTSIDAYNDDYFKILADRFLIM